jgi:hypothetical protein
MANTSDITLEVKKNELTDYVRLQLGDGIIDLEMDQEHYEAAYQKTLGTYRQRATNAFEESYAFLEMTEDQNFYKLPDEIQSVRQVFRRTIGNMQGPYSSSFDPFAASSLNTYLINYNYAGGLATYEMWAGYTELAARMFGGFLNYTFNPVTKQIQFIRNARGSGETVLLWTYNLRPEIQLLTDYSTSQWFKDYMIGASKAIIGEAREKFATIAGPQGGTALNGAAMKAEGQAIMDAKIEDLKNYVDGSQPLTWVIG